jgi:hypothetical protein
MGKIPINQIPDKQTAAEDSCIQANGKVPIPIQPKKKRIRTN